jgi:uncharacterized membrane protein YeaQ/YmgE (transglycosylase-associated protein family)
VDTGLLMHPPLWAIVSAAWLMVGALIGAMVGWWRNRLLQGTFAGAVLGPVGWWAVGRLPGRFRECPACSRAIRSQLRTCPHCGANVLRVDHRSARSSLKGKESSRSPW